MIQKLLGVIPAGDALHHMLQRTAGGLRDFDRELKSKVEDWTLMSTHLESAGVRIAGGRFVEIGTGWYPCFPFCLYLGGAASVETLDLNRHLRKDLTLGCAEGLGRHVDSVAIRTLRSVERVADAQRSLVDALRHGASVNDATRGVVRYRAPADAAETNIPAASVDVVFSNSVLEHVPKEVIGRCFAEARRILRPGGIMFHSVNCGDHYAYFDESINQLNYLRYSDKEWRLWNNDFLYQNRLRAVDFTEMAADAGFTIELDTSRARAARLAELDEIPVHPRFNGYSVEQLAITSIDFIGRNP